MAAVPDTPENMSRCICTDCPSYYACMRERNERLFCARGKSACDVTEKGCVCGVCPLTTEFNLARLYFCDSAFQ